MKLNCRKHGDVEAESHGNGDVICPCCLEEHINSLPGYPRIAEAVGKALIAPSAAGAVPDSFEEVPEEEGE